MIQVPITNVPNQSFTIEAGGNIYDITIRLCATATQNPPLYYDSPIMAMDIITNNVTTILGQRLVCGYPVIPYRYLESGNFVFVTQNDDLPDWNQFGITQFLVYATSDEIASLRAGL